MANQQQKDKDNNSNTVNNYLKFSGIAFQMICIIGVAAFAGYKIDQSMKHETMWVTAVLSLIGVFISLYLVIKSLKD